MKNRTLLCRMLVLSSLCVATLTSVRSAAAQSAEFERVDAPELESLTFEGSVHSPDGTPAAGAVVVSSAGGQAVTDADGEFRLEAHVPVQAKRVQVTAVGRSSSKLLASTSVSLAAATSNVPLVPLQLAHSSTCSPTWLPTFGEFPGTPYEVRALAAFDAGNGQELYAGGLFGLAKWDGSSWVALSSTVSATPISGVEALLVFDDGSGPALFVGGAFFHADAVSNEHIAKWDGASWSSVGGGMNSEVHAFAVFDDGNGDALYAGGLFTVAGGVAVNRVAKWNGVSWSPLGSGISGLAGLVEALCVFDDGNGEELYVGGAFTSAGGAPALRIAKWNGALWSPVGSGVNAAVRALAVYDNGGGDSLYVGGDFTVAGGLAASRVAEWDGSMWANLGAGVVDPVHAMLAFDDGGGERLFVGSLLFGLGGGLPQSNRLESWDGTNWSSPGLGVNGSVEALAAFDDGNGERLIVGGRFGGAGDSGAASVASWDGSNWSAFGSGLGGRVFALTVFDDGGGPALYVGGDFNSAGSGQLGCIAKWSGSGWEMLGGGVNHHVRALTVFDDGNGERLIAGGLFTIAGGVPAARIAQWDGLAWAPLGSGVGDWVQTLAVFDEGNGERLFAGGQFTTAGGAPANRIAKWDGVSWSALDAGTNGIVFAMALFDSGGGEELCVGGSFSLAGAVAVSQVARWNGSNWSALDGGVTATVRALTVFDDGGGPALYSGGNAIGVNGERTVQKWNGSNWALLNGGFDGTVLALSVFDDGSGSALYAGGEFSTAGGLVADGLAKWDGSNWSALSSLSFESVEALLPFDDGSGEALIVGGDFRTLFDSRDSYIAKWGCAPELMNDFCNGDSGDGLGCTNCPCANNAPLGTIGGCLNSVLTSERLIGSGSLSVSLPLGSNDDLRFALTGAPPTAFCTLNSGDAVAPNNPANACFGMDSGVQSVLLDGLRCAIVNTRRHGGRSADANGSIGALTAAWGGSSNPPAGIAQAGGGFAAGQTRYFQVFHREDPLLGCGRGLNTSQGVEVTFAP